MKIHILVRAAAVDMKQRLASVSGRLTTEKKPATEMTTMT